jgi:hypothetical protein
VNDWRIKDVIEKQRKKDKGKITIREKYKSMRLRFN